MDYESTQEGTLLKIIRGEGSSSKVGDTIAILGEEGEKTISSREGESEARGAERLRAAKRLRQAKVPSRPLRAGYRR